MASAWRAELFWLILLSLAATLVTRLTGSLGIGVVVAMLVYLGRHVVYMNRLLRWLRSGKSGQLPPSDGIWEEIFYLVYRIRRRNKRRKKQLLEVLDRFRTATAALPDATVVLGARNEIRWFNASAADLLGLRKTDVGQQINNLLRSPRFARYLADDEREAILSMPSPIVPDSELEVRVVPYGDDDAQLLVARDVTQLRRMERIRTDFVAHVSHELRTPITVLRGYMEAVADSGDELPERYQKIFRRIEDQTARMQHLIEGLLALTRLESNRTSAPLQLVPIAPLLRQICEEAEVVTDAHPEIELEIESSADLLGMEQELRSAFSNLIFNAMKYTPVDGSVVVRWRDTDGGASLDVEDTGPGVAPEHLSRLTERFYRVEVEGCRNKSGSGLGLAIVKHALSRHDARLEIHSEPGHGSRFSCCFPANRVVRESHARAAIPAS
ncbi:MAG: phosphate regulon sensor histidine kinase PhoR [Methylotetracoccus sp.]